MKTAAASLLIACILVLLPFALAEPRGELFDGDYSAVVTDKDGEIIRVYLNSEEQWILPPASGLPEKLVTSVLSYEDRYFFNHGGVNPVSVLRAAGQNIRAGKSLSGASTITMQLARIAKPKGRSLINKIKEIFSAIKLEFLYNKEEILALYLNYAPYGGNIRGVRAASLRYFGKEASALTWAEAACLAVLPNAPGLISPGKEAERLLEKRNRLLEELQRSGHMDEDDLGLAKAEPLPEKEMPFPNLAPHFADHLLGASNDRRDPNGSIQSTIDRKIQTLVGERLRNHGKFLHSYGIENAAVLVAETESGKVRAYHGSLDYFDLNIHGSIDGLQAPRSTGSVLKPFLYALAMDEGMLADESLIPDIPSTFAAFSPQNADRDYRGLVRSREALIQSLNVPAARLLSRYGLLPFYRFLEEAGISTLFRSPSDYGLPLILGGAEARPIDIACLYRGLGRGGIFGPLTLIEENSGTSSADGRTKGLRLISPGASYLCLDILKELVRPGSEALWGSFQDKYPLAWKTGTSYGQRDAWAAGVSPEWTIVVWAGNFSGEANANLRSGTSAGSLLFDIFNSLPKDPGKAWFQPEVGTLKTVELCTESGYRAGPACDNVVEHSVPSNAPPLAECPYHKHIFVSLDEKYRVDSRCWEPGGYKKVSRLIYPPEVMQFLRERGQNLESVPPFKPGCSGERGLGNPLAVSYPEDGARFYLPLDLNGELQRITIRAAHSKQNSLIYWYLNGNYLGSTKENHRMSPELDRGKQVLHLVDEDGYSTDCKFYVYYRNGAGKGRVRETG